MTRMDMLCWNKKKGWRRIKERKGERKEKYRKEMEENYTAIVGLEQSTEHRVAARCRSRARIT